MRSLQTLIKKYKLSTEYTIYGTDKGTIHSYIELLYAPLFKQNNFDEILEIGIKHGASCALWSLHYPNSNIEGFDKYRQTLHPVAKILEKEKKIKFFYEDAYSAKLNKEFDLIIDDGPHTTLKQIRAFYFHKKLTPNGILIIEDIYRKKIVPTVIKCLNFRASKYFIFADFSEASGRIDDAVVILSNNPAILNLDSIKPFIKLSNVRKNRFANKSKL
jgi:hypothetical protein